MATRKRRSRTNRPRTGGTEGGVDPRPPSEPIGRWEGEGGAPPPESDRPEGAKNPKSRKDPEVEPLER
jgi:hypothetical protein